MSGKKWWLGASLADIVRIEEPPIKKKTKMRKIKKRYKIRKSDNVVIRHRPEWLDLDTVINLTQQS